MHMAVEDGLSCRLTSIDAYVKCYDRFVSFLNLLLLLIQQGVKRISFRLIEIKEVSHMPFRDDQGVMFGDRVSVTNCITEFVLTLDLSIYA